MLELCEEIKKESELYRTYEQVVSDHAQWYNTIHKKYALQLKDWVRDEHTAQHDSEFETLVKEKPLLSIEPLLKVALAKFSYGPSKLFFKEFDLDGPQPNDKNSWIDKAVQIDFAKLAEILARTLEKSKTPHAFDLKVLSDDRDQRNDSVHRGVRIQCLALIRKYESIRELLAFLDPKYEALPRFMEDAPFDYNGFISEPCAFSFQETATVLIVGSVHDIERGYRSAVANLPWDVVIDFDGYSDSGGLLSSVTHNSIRKELLLADKTYPLPPLNQSQTAWYLCGEYLMPDYRPVPEKRPITVLGRQPFMSETKYFNKLTQRAMKNAFRHITQLLKPVNILILSDDCRIPDAAISAFQDLEFEEYYMTWVGLDTSWIEDNFARNRNSDFCKEHFCHQTCPIRSFFAEFYEYRENYTFRSFNNIDYALPTGSGSFVSVPENVRNNLSPYFEVLYKDWELADDPENASADSFYQGGRATWRDIATCSALHLDEDIEQRLAHQIKSYTGTAQEYNPQNKFFFLEHKAGIGGTTFVKQVAWSLHQDMAVLEVKRYDKDGTFRELQNLYDNVIGKNPILLVAEDTLPDLDAMCEAFLSSMRNRRCALLIACRENGGISSSYKSSHIEKFHQLKAGAIEALIHKFKSISKLSPAELEKKSRAFRDEVTGAMLTPFIIGLYFLEKDFHIDSYVGKVLDGSLPPMQKEMIAILALCDVYGSKYLPSLFVNKMLGFNPQRKTSLIQSCPGAESLICSSKIDGIDVYHFKHVLLSERYLDRYKERQGSLLELIEKLIEYTANCRPAWGQEDVMDTLLNILIRNKNDDQNPENDKLSRLLSDIAVRDQQRSLIRHLAEKFQPLADSLNADEKDDDYYTKVFRLVSHAYAHLGKLYTMFSPNYKEAAKYLALAEDYMPYEDPFIYHMHGHALHRQLHDDWGKVPESQAADGASQPDDNEDRVDEALALFEKTCEFGDMQYGLTGELYLLVEYLQFLYRRLGIQKEEDLNNLTPKQNSYRVLLSDVLAEAEECEDFDESFLQEFQKIKDKARAGVLMGDFRKTIQYYQNEYDKLKNDSNPDRASEMLYGLVSAKLQKAREEYSAEPNRSKSLYQRINNPTTLFEQISTLLPPLYSKSDYRSYVKRTFLFRHWFQLAKLLNWDITDAAVMARYWLESEDVLKRKKNPEPYYYQAVLSRLKQLEGEKCEGERWPLASADAPKRFDQNRLRRNKLRDLLVEGKGMGRLLNVSDCGSATELANRIITSGKTPSALAGNMESPEHGHAEFFIYEPRELMRQMVRSEIGRLAKNTLSEEQVNHKVKFLAGFTLEGMWSIGPSVRDQSTGGVFDIPAILAALRDWGAGSVKSQKRQLEQAAPPPKAPPTSQPVRSALASRNNQESGERKTFHPKSVYPDNSKPKYLNGTVDDGKGSIKVSYLVDVFTEKKVEAYGGIRDILKTLIKAGSLDTKVENVRIEDGGKRYRLVLYDETIELPHLLGLQKKTAYDSHAPVTEEVGIQLPDLSGKSVEFIPSDPTLEQTNGTFLYKGATFAGKLLGIKSNNDRKRAQKFSGRIPAVVQGKPQAGKYNLKMKG